MDPRRIPLPNEMPQAPELENLSPKVLHTATVETLIGYSDDLASRLKVHLRRGSQLEQQIFDLEQELSNSEQIRSSLSAQMEILREKDHVISEKQNSYETRIARLKSDLDLAKIQQDEQSQIVIDTKRELARLQAYQRRIHLWVRPSLELQKKEITNLKNEIEILETKKTATQALLVNLKEELQFTKSETDRRLISGEKDRARLVDTYEKQLRGLNEENKKLSLNLMQSQEKAHLVAQTTSESAKVNNEKVFFERRAEELERQLTTETDRLQTTIDDLSKEIATLRATVESARKQAEDADKKRIHAEELRQRADAQLQGLRESWKENSLSLKALESKNEALEQLNAELSKKLAEKRLKDRTTLSDQSLDQVGFIDDLEAREQKLKKLDVILSDLEMKAFGLDKAP